MRFCIQGIESAIEVLPGRPFVLAIDNKTLYSRVVQSLFSEEGECATEPYTCWSCDGKSIKPKGAAIVIPSPFCLPWDCRDISGGLYARIEALIMEDEGLRSEVETRARDLRVILQRAALSLRGDYEFKSEWDAKKYLKAFSFGYDADMHQSLFDSLISFFGAVEDACLEKPLVFVNFQSYFDGEKMRELFSRLLQSNMKVLFLECNWPFARVGDERILQIDQHFLEIER
ncbi:type II-A CRISPR-associated protein Csn2 [Berryella wangjianweii]|uniref:Type II-A CRISPR-associated protein Csn2 n=1 Tax=Berryella wangjianweii TaxID=2734634 RepID=A0A6M8J8H1_9ACTN|nr:type II-A CRISPR-associated protein Csn2 [Berryella wangjianweii]QKF07162.1 type II-A CRISPR-associated protein Csn2 [Berryella wangjianweii]